MGMYLLYTFYGLLIPCLVQALPVDLLELSGAIINNIHTLTSKDWRLLWKLGNLNLPDISNDVKTITLHFSGNDLKSLDFIIRGRDPNGKCVRSEGYASTMSKTNEGKFKFNFTDPISSIHRIYWIIEVNDNYLILYSCKTDTSILCKENMIQIFSIHSALSEAHTIEVNQILLENFDILDLTTFEIEDPKPDPCTEQSERCMLENFPIVTKPDYNLLNGDWYVIRYYGAHPVIFPRGSRSLAVSITANNGMIWIKFYIRNSERSCIDSKQGSANLFGNQKNIMKFSIQSRTTDLVILEHLFDKNPVFYFCESMLINGTCSHESILVLVLSQHITEHQDFTYLDDICIDIGQVTRVDFSRERACGINEGTTNYFVKWSLLLIILSLVIS